MRSLYLLFLLIFISYICEVLADKKGSPYRINISSTEKGDFDKNLSGYKKELEKKFKHKSYLNKQGLVEAEGRDLLLKFLWSYGYYSAEVEVASPDNPSKPEIPVTFNINPASQYTIKEINIKLSDSSAASIRDLSLPKKSLLKLTSGSPAIADRVLKEEGRIFEYIENNNCLLRLEVFHEAQINYITHTVDITYKIKAGRLAHIDRVSFKGLHEVNPNYARKLVPIKDHSCFRRGEINQAKTALQGSGLFTFIEPEIPNTPDAGGDVEVTFKVKEGVPHTVKAGINYSTDVGIGFTTGWEHRNFFSKGEKVSTTLSLSRVEKRLEGQLEKPFFLSDKQTLKIGSSIEKKDNKSFSSRGISVSATFERILFPTWNGGVGTKYTFNQITEEARRKDFSLLSTPLFITHDTRNNLLEPRHGVSLTAQTAPFINIGGNKSTFLKSSVSAASYFYFPVTLKPLLAVRAGLGGVSSLKGLNLPATERFYVGGGNSVRGYGYQLAGPLNAKKDPIGGESFMEASAELRIKLKNKLGLVGFIDSGSAFAANYPKLSNKLYTGAGIGLRYYTTVGPIRVDIGVPLSKRRKKVDSSFQLYFGIGQAF